MFTYLITLREWLCLLNFFKNRNSEVQRTKETVTKILADILISK